MRTSSPQIVLETPAGRGAESPSGIVRLLDAAVFSSLCAMLAFAPLAFGAVEPWAVFVLQSGSSFIALLLIAKHLAGGVSGGLRNQALLPAVLFVALAIIQVGFDLSLYRHASYVELLRVIAYGIAFVAALECLRSSDRLRQFAMFLSIFGFLVAVLAIAQHFTAPEKIYWFRIPSQAGSIFGPYVNRNHYAGLMEMLTPFAVMGFLVPYERREKRAWMLFSAALMGASLVLSLSRSGVVALLVEMLFLAGFLSLSSRKNRAAIGVAALALPLAALAFWLGSAKVLERFSTLQDALRGSINRDGLRMFADHWAMGTGLGTFPTVYPQYRSFSTDLFVNQAHNDALQLMIEMGLPGLLLVLWFLFVVYRHGLSKAQGWITRWKNAASLAALTGITGLLLHSLTDFNLRIPANALLFCVLCGVAAARERDNALLIERSPRFRRSPELEEPQ